MCGKNPLEGMRDDTMVDISTQRGNGTLLRLQCDAYRFDPLRPYASVEPQYSVGTAFLVRLGDAVRILTAHHVVENATRVTCTVRAVGDGEPRTLRVVGLQPDLDVALLEEVAAPTSTGLDGSGSVRAPPLCTLPAFEIGRSSRLATNARVRCLGFGKGTQHEHDTLGAVSGRHDYPHNRVQVDAAVNPGCSGGPVVSMGRVVGVITTSETDAQSTNYFAPMDEVAVAVSRMPGVDRGLSLNAVFSAVSARACEDGEEGGALVVACAPSSALRRGDVVRAVRDACDGAWLPLDAHMKVLAPGTWAHDRLDFRTLLDAMPKDARAWRARVRRGRTTREMRLELAPPEAGLRRLCPDADGVRYVAFGGMVIQMLSRTHAEHDPERFGHTIDATQRFTSVPVITHVEPGSPFTTDRAHALVGARVRRVLASITEGETPPLATLEEVARAVSDPRARLVELGGGAIVGATRAAIEAYEAALSKDALRRGRHVVGGGGGGGERRKGGSA